jgi:hypothetical protein
MLQLQKTEIEMREAISSDELNRHEDKYLADEGRCFPVFSGG